MKEILEKLRQKTRPAMSRRFVAVAMATRFIRLAHAERSGAGAKIIRLAEVVIPDGLNLEDPEATGDFLGQALRENRMGGLPVVMAVSRSQAVLKSLELPAGTAETEMPSMVQYQVQGELPFRAEDAVIDFTREEHYNADAAKPASTDSRISAGVHLLIAAVRLPVVDYYRRVVAAAGCRLDRLAFRPYANIRCVGACTVREADEHVAVVHVMSGETEIEVIAGDSLAFSRSATVRIPAWDKATHSEIEDAVNGVMREVLRSVQSYQTSQGGQKIRTILVAGGTGIEGRLIQTLAQKLGVACEQFDPSGALKLTGQEHASAFISVLGIALGYYDKGGLRLDFLNPKKPQQRPDLKKVFATYALTIGLLVAMAMLGARLLYVAPKEAAVQKLRAERRNLDANAKMVKNLADRVTQITDWNRGNQDWLAHLANVSTLLPGAKDMYVTNFNVSGDGAIILPLKAFSNDALDEMLRRIHESGEYDLKTGAFDSVPDPWGFIYKKDVTLLPYPATGPVDFSTTQSVARPGDDVSAEALLKREGVPVAAIPTPASPAGPTPVSRPTVAAPAVSPSGSTAGTDIPVVPGRKYGPFADLSAMTDQERIQWGIQGKFDLTGRGKLSPEEEKARTEFRTRLIRMMNSSSEKAQLLKRFDKDGDGKLKNSEYRVMETRLWQEECLSKGVGK